MAELFGQFWNKRKTISSASSDESRSLLKPRKRGNTSQQQEDEIMTALNMSQDMEATLKAILAKLEKLDTIESAVMKIEAKLESLEERTQSLEDCQTTAKKDIDELKDSINFTGNQLKDKTVAWEKVHQLYESQLAELTKKSQENEELLNEINTKNLNLESYSPRENIKFMKIEEFGATGGCSEDTEEVLRTFLERDLGYMEATSVEIQRIHRVGKSKDGKPRPILARFLRYKDCQQIFALGHRLKDTDFQMFRGPPPPPPQKIITHRKKQMEAFKDARKHEVAASFSQSQPDKLYIRGKLWPVGQKFTA